MKNNHHLSTKLSQHDSIAWEIHPTKLEKEGRNSYDKSVVPTIRRPKNTRRKSLLCNVIHVLHFVNLTMAKCTINLPGGRQSWPCGNVLYSIIHLCRRRVLLETTGYRKVRNEKKKKTTRFGWKLKDKTVGRLSPGVLRHIEKFGNYQNRCMASMIIISVLL